MQWISIYLVTIIISFIFELDNFFIIFKDVGDAGYKIDIDKLSNFMDKIPNSQKDKFLLRILIPFYNVFNVMKDRLVYNQQKFSILDELNLINCIEEMTELEKVEYRKSPTALNAIFVPVKIYFEMNRAAKVTFARNQGIIWFINDKTAKDIKILDAKGPISNLSLEEQKEKVKTSFINFYDNIVKSFGTLENFKNEILLSSENINSQIDVFDNIIESFGSLENFKNEILLSSKNTNYKINISPKTRREKINDLKQLKEEFTETKETSIEQKGYQKK